MVSYITLVAIALLVGFIPGLLLFHWLASPFGPGIPLMGEAFARIFMTVSQVIRDAGVLVKRASGEYEIGTYIPERGQVMLTDGTMPIDEDSTRWSLFGKRKFGITWEPGTDLHNRIARDVETDGGELPINMGAAHRYMRGVNDSDAITRTENKAKAEYGGGSDQLSDLTMALLVGLMLLLGSMTTWLMLG